MPIEIKELHIRVVVDDAAKAGGTPAGGSSGSKGGVNADEIVSRCVEEVMRIMERKKER